MFEKILIANRGDQPPSGGAAAKPNCLTGYDRQGVFAVEATHV
jgi:hypothetical protein